MNLRVLTALAAVALLCVIAQPVAGGGTRAAPVGTNVQGEIIGTVSWTAANSPYWVIGDVTVTAAGNLTVEPGASVMFRKSTRLTVDGTMKANGTLLKGITFSSAAANPTISDWTGIWVNAGGKASFTHATLQYSKAGVNVTGGTVWMDNCSMRFHSLAAARAGEGSYVTVTNSYISSCQYDGLMFDNASRGAARRNEITSCQYGIVSFSEAEISDNSIVENFIGIYSYNNTGNITDNTITTCWDGIIAFYSDPVITGNTIQGCLGNGTRFFMSNATFTGNNLQYNRIGLDIPYDSRGVLANMTGNLVNGIDISDYYFYGVNGVHLSGLHFDSGWNAGYTGNLNGQGAFTFYDCRNVVVEDCLIENNWHGIGLVGTTAVMKNCTMRNLERSPGFLDLGSELTAENVSYEGGNYTIIDDSSIALEYEYVRALVRNESHVGLAGARCNFTENERDAGTYYTDAFGYTPWELVQDRVHTTVSGTFVNTISIDVEYGGRAFDGDSREFTLVPRMTVVFTDLGDIWAPSVLSFAVAGGAEKANLTPVMTLRFDEEMDRDSVENATRMYAGNATVALAFAWDGWNATITPQEPLEYSTTYAFTVAATATDLRGNALEEPYAGTITTGVAPAAISDETLMYVAIAAGVVIFLGIIFYGMKLRKKE